MSLYVYNDEEDVRRFFKVMDKLIIW
jgi:selenocysteine lyase/cysteine desulfurase